ncbi:Transposable element P transposase [Frankliniella fusca]|uniref:Transposable element P transposase n=1 Tax=Frankliniella fusca TaxID=407009 RepID=A0AAE1HEF9_9NEOP|nr:Transposable element P transposase [Frankliniella fusca]
MPYCFVPKCKGGSKAQIQYYEDNNLPKLHFFQAPDEVTRILEARKKWSHLIKRENTVSKGKRKERELQYLKNTEKVCSAHFPEKDLILYYEHKVNGNVVRIPRDRALLKPGALPVLLNQYPLYYQPKVVERKPPAQRPESTPSAKRKKKSDVEDLEITDNSVNENVALEDLNTTASKNDDSVNSDISNNATEIQSSTSAETWSCCSIKNMKLPIDWVPCNTLSETEKFVAHINPKDLVMDKIIIFKGTDLPVIKIRGVSVTSVDLPPKLCTTTDAEKIVHKVDQIGVCAGTAEKERHRKIEMRIDKVEERKEKKKNRIKNTVRSLKRSKINLLSKIQKYKIKLDNMQAECQKKNETVLNEAVGKLPKAQQEAVKACFDASKRKGPSGNRYTAQWVYECMLMRIKDKKLYNHIRVHQILPLPTVSTINGYLRNYGGTYGFQPQTLQLLAEKTEGLKSRQRRGVLLIDEAKLQPGAYFDSSLLKIGGFKDFGEQNEEDLGEDFREEVEEALAKLPEDPLAPQRLKRQEKRKEQNQHKRDKTLGDHALVITFQPFIGKWVQTIACFLSKGNANSDELTKLILEATILLEKSNLLVDGVITDGASWNRSMWIKFGINEDNPSAEHPCDPTRRLWFLSDFPHLLKCMRNCLVKDKIIMTPEGDIKLEHWRAIVDANKLKQIGIRAAHKLTSDHLNPSPWQKMNCRMAWEFWSRSAAAAMESLRFQGCDQVDDCSASIKWCQLINDLADSMNANRPENAVRLESDAFKKIGEFLEEFIKLKDWRNKKLRDKLEMAEKARLAHLRKQGKNPRGKSEKYFEQQDWVFSDSTDIGLIVSLKAAQEIIKFLREKEGFLYVMTARLNQDALERFFGLMRQSCGRNTHPEPRVFAQLFRLLSIYSLVKPIRGSNITGGDMVTTLLNLEDLRKKPKAERHKALSDKLDEIILGENLEDIPEVLDHVDHAYLNETVDEFALRYVSGFMARHAKKYANNCSDCLESLQKPATERNDLDLLITHKSRGGLIYPSDKLVNLVGILEKKVIDVSLNNELEENILFVVLDALSSVRVGKVGCLLHEDDLTKCIMKSYLIMRMHFVSRRWNEKTREQRDKQKGLRKQAHLT